MKIKQLWADFGRKFADLFNGIAGNCPHCGCAEYNMTFDPHEVECCKCKKLYKTGV